MLVLHPVNTSAAVQTSTIKHSRIQTQGGDDPIQNSKEQHVQTQIKEQVKNICYGMVREIFRETASRQGSSLDHGEVGSSHMSDSTTDLNNVNNVRLDSGTMANQRAI